MIQDVCTGQEAVFTRLTNLTRATDSVGCCSWGKDHEGVAGAFCEPTARAIVCSRGFRDFIFQSRVTLRKRTAEAVRGVGWGGDLILLLVALYDILTAPIGR